MTNSLHADLTTYYIDGFWAPKCDAAASAKAFEDHQRAVAARLAEDVSDLVDFRL